MKAEIRGRGRHWKVWYEDEGGIPTEHLVYDRNGIVVHTLKAGAPSKGFVEASLECHSKDEAEAYARYLGATEITVRRTLSRSEAMERARRARNRAA